MEELDNQYGTLSEAVDDLTAKGYTNELRAGDGHLYKGDQELDPSTFTIDSFHRFEGPTDPGDMSIVYAISSAALGTKGLLIGSYGAEAEMDIHRLVRGLSAHTYTGQTQPVLPAGSKRYVKY